MNTAYVARTDIANCVQIRPKIQNFVVKLAYTIFRVETVLQRKSLRVGEVRLESLYLAALSGS